jgi:hypothetical protein
MTYDLDDDEEDHHHHYPIPLNLRDATNQLHDQSILIPKTMTQFAEDVAAAQQDLQVSSQQGRFSQPRNVNSIDKGITKPIAGNDNSSNSVETVSTGKVSKLSEPAAAATTTTVPRRWNTRGTATGRKRTRNDVSEGEAETDTELDDDDDEEFGASPSDPGKKRTKRTRSAIGTSRSIPITTKRRKNAPGVAIPTRTLRPRTSKGIVVYAENDDDEG